jgi:glycosyltransferase involved in cell wall biosynthesis/tetratricopeptide (TPR) repeat protein
MGQTKKQRATRWSVDWEGDVFQHHSLSLINRALCTHLLGMGLDLAVRALDLSLATNDGTTAALLADALDVPPRSPTVTVRHSWPPRFSPRPAQLWVHIQPWEFGGIPDAWTRSLRDATEVWSYSSWVRDNYVASGLAPDKVQVVPSGVDVDLFKPDGPRYVFAQDRSFRFLFVGGFIGRKGVDLLLNSYINAFSRNDDVCLVLKGFGAGGVYANGLHDQVRALAANADGPAIEVIEDDLPDDQMASLYRSCDVLVHPYRGEGFAMPVAEAMASGVPVVVTADGATSDFCDQDNAWLLPSRRVPIPEVDGAGPSSLGYWLAEPDAGYLTQLLRELPGRQAASAAKATRARERIVPAYGWDAVADIVARRLEHLASHHDAKRAQAKGGGRHTPRNTINARKSSPAAGRTLLSACLIVKDEETALPDCLESLHRLVDEVVVYDTGSTDSTVSLAKRAGARVIEGYWDDDFSRARNASLEQCRSEWVLWIDADERFRCDQVRGLRGALAAMPSDALSIEIRNLGEEIDTANANMHRALRIFRKDRCLWYGPVHEQVDLRPGLASLMQVTPLNGAHIDHLGYRNDVVEARGKLQRNIHLAELALARDDAKPGQEGVAELNVGRALAAVGRCEEAQSYFRSALAKTAPGIATRATLLFSAQNLVNLGHFEEAAAEAARLRDLCQKKDLSYFLEGMARRRMGQADKAVELFELAEDMSNEDGFVFSDVLLRAELAGALCDAGRAGDAADQLAILVERAPEVKHIRAALNVFAATGKSFADLAAVMPENRLERVAAALVLVPPVIADPVAEALWRRFGPRPQILAAAIRFAPLIATSRTMEWSARLRAIGMSYACPLIAQAQIDVLNVPERVRAAVTAHAAFADPRGADLADALTAGLRPEEVGPVSDEVALLDPALAERFARAVGGQRPPTPSEAGPLAPPSLAGGSSRAAS